MKRVYIDKPGSKKKRPLGIPSVVDRICQQAAHNVLSPVFEEYFHAESYGFRPGRSTKMAARRIEGFKRKGYRIGVDIDIKGFFDLVNSASLDCPTNNAKVIVFLWTSKPKYAMRFFMGVVPPK